MAAEIEKLAQFIAQTQWDDIPQAVQQRTKLVLLDTFGVMLAGSEQPEVRALQKGLAATAGTGATVYMRGWPVTDPGRAALVNGIAARTLELGELHLDVSAQAAIQILPGILATAESSGSTGREMLAALAVAYDFAIRLARATTRRPLAHPVGQGSLLAAIAAAARIRGLDAAGTSAAVRIGANLMVTASYSNVAAGGTTLNVNGGVSGFMASLAPELAIAGFRAQEDAIEQALAHLVGDAFDPSSLLDGLGTRWEVERNLFRLRACCNPIYPALDALEDCLAELHPKPEEIERIDCGTYAFAANMRNQDPPNYFGGKYSFPHAAAALAAGRDLAYDAFSEDAMRDPAIAALRRRVHIAEDPNVKLGGSRLKGGATVTLTLKDGRKATHGVENDKRYTANVTEPQVREKFRKLAGVVLTKDGVAAVEEAIDGMERWTSIEPLLAALRGHAR